MNSRNQSDATYPITYEFTHPDGSIETFDIVLDEITVSLLNFDSSTAPSWTRLGYHQCACCPLSEEDVPFCPVAVNIAQLIDRFKGHQSIDPCTVRCITPERTYIKEDISIQKALSSILGIIMATSDCPVMSFYRPMARFHLPFSTTRETIFRSASLYLLQEYFEYKRGREPDLEMKKLGDLMERVRVVNRGILDRVRSITVRDADPNAIIILDSFSAMLGMEVDAKLSSLSYLFPPR